MTPDIILGKFDQNDPQKIDPSGCEPGVSSCDAVRAIVRREGRAPVMVLSLEHILESVFRSAIANEPNEKLGERV